MGSAKEAVVGEIVTDRTLPLQASLLPTPTSRLSTVIKCRSSHVTFFPFFFFLGMSFLSTRLNLWNFRGVEHVTETHQRGDRHTGPLPTTTRHPHLHLFPPPALEFSSLKSQRPGGRSKEIQTIPHLLLVFQRRIELSSPHLLTGTPPCSPQKTVPDVSR